MLKNLLGSSGEISEYLGMCLFSLELFSSNVPVGCLSAVGRGMCLQEDAGVLGGNAWDPQGYMYVPWQ